MIKFARVCDLSQKDFRNGKGLLKVQGLSTEINYNVENSKEVVINDTIIENARLYNLSSEKVVVDIDDITNITKAQRKDLKNGIIESANGKYNGLECKVYYNQIEKEFEIILDIELLLYI